jgi:hypothetical protein
MFAAIAEIIATPARADAMANDHERYSRVAEAHPGLLFKHVMRADDDPQRFIDVMAWESQTNSEAFGIDPQFQRIRPSLGGPYDPVVPARSWMNPGYYGDRHSIVRDCVGITRQVVGYFHAAHGHERDFARIVDQLAAEIASRAEPVGFWAFVNLGLPEWWCVVLQRDDAALEHLPQELSQLCSLPPTVDVGDLVMRFDRRESAS